MTLWRLCNGTQFWDNHNAGGRWYPPGRGVIALDPTPAAALCAALAFAEVAHPRLLPSGYRLHQLEVPQEATLPVQAPRRWHSDLQLTRALGQDWLDTGKSLLLCVPTVHGGYQYLLNTRHPDAQKCRLQASFSYPFGQSVAQVQSLLSEDAEWLAVLEANEVQAPA
ncbi:hypothetical protein PT7_0262 [Pusillimonas sp. T7-7]|uniref:RES family NAD+ phosphorylase n=1 Tax=Pusillimonas sp. (strain T7-7) TaxID=1007105 RepID=UPI0002084AE8|nr:RES family NAD+ phosphorylase [Pusillimonas sp. T7-7]AEC18802.1 hypothetical protein PT7_0262 [Pusillimonas sp. T7-7]